MPSGIDCKHQINSMASLEVPCLKAKQIKKATTIDYFTIFKILSHYFYTFIFFSINL